MQNIPLPLAKRLESLFGRHWQAALDHGGVISRRRGRALGAGDSPSAALVALVEMLECVPVAQWPARWRELGKSADSCPTLALFPERLVNGRIRREDTVLLWDVEPDGRVVNLTVGLLPPHRRLTGRALRVWRCWNCQWQCANGGGMLTDWMQYQSLTPEGIIADMIFDGMLDAVGADVVLKDFARRVDKFSVDQVHEMVAYLRAARTDDPDGDIWAGYVPGAQYQPRNGTRPRPPAKQSQSDTDAQPDDPDRWRLLTVEDCEAAMLEDARRRKKQKRNGETTASEHENADLSS
jgi:hypothetical protein